MRTEAIYSLNKNAGQEIGESQDKRFHNIYTRLYTIKKTRSTLKKPFIFSPTIYNLKIICYKTIIFSFFVLKLFSRNWVEDVIYFKFV